MLQEWFLFCMIGLATSEFVNVILKDSSFKDVGLINGVVLPTERYLPGETGKIVPIRFSALGTISGIDKLSTCQAGGCIPIVVINKEARYSNGTMALLNRLADIVIIGFEASPDKFNQGSWEHIKDTPLVLIEYNDARTANLMVEKGVVTYASISPYTNHMKRREHFMKLGVLFLVFASACFILAMRVRAQRSIYVIRRHAQQNLKERKAKQKVAQLPTRLLKINEPSSECTICLEEKKFPSKVKVLQCGHEYHDPCITPWLVSHGTCPLCKYNVLDDRRSESEDCHQNMTDLESGGITNPAAISNASSDDSIVSLGLSVTQNMATVNQTDEESSAVAASADQRNHSSA